MTEQEFGNIASGCSCKLRAPARRFSRSTDLSMDADDIVQEALTALWNLSEKGYPVRNADDAFISGCSASDRFEEQDAEFDRLAAQQVRVQRD